MKRAISLIIAAVLVLSLAGCAAEKPSEKLYCMSHEREAVWLVDANGSEKVFELPEDVLTAGICGSRLWYTEDGAALVRVDLADGTREEFELPENSGVGYFMIAEEDAAYVSLCTVRTEEAPNYKVEVKGAIFRVGADGAEPVTGEYDWNETLPFAVDGGSVYHAVFGWNSTTGLVREDADGTVTEFDWPGFPLICLSVDGGRVFACWMAGCRSYDAATGGDEKIETSAGTFSAEDALPDEYVELTDAQAHDGWLYFWTYRNPDSSVTIKKPMLFMARRISDEKAVEYTKCDDVGFYAFENVVTFGEQGFVINGGYQKNEFRYFPYYSGK